MNFIPLLKSIIKQNKEIYYPLVTVLFSFSLYWILNLGLNFTDNRIIFPFIFLILAVLIFIFSRDISRISKKDEQGASKVLIYFLISISLLIELLVIIDLMFLIYENILYLIPVSIYISVSFLIYLILSKQVKKYYAMKNHRR